MSAQAGRTAIPMDLVLGDGFDLATDGGFCNSLFHICNLKVGASMMAAPVCGSWVFMPLCVLELISTLFPDPTFSM